MNWLVAITHNQQTPLLPGYGGERDMTKRMLVNASEERDHFYDLIGKQVTFASEIITIGGQISHTKGEKATISDVAYVTGFWSRLCPDIYNKPKISTIRINGIEHTCWIPDSFEEFRNANLESNK